MQTKGLVQKALARSQRKQMCWKSQPYKLLTGAKKEIARDLFHVAQVGGAFWFVVLWGFFVWCFGFFCFLSSSSPPPPHPPVPSLLSYNGEILW